MALALMYLLSACGGESIGCNDIGGGKIPPFDGTIYITPNIIKDSDPTSFVGLSYTGQAIRSMYDDRIKDNLLFKLKEINMIATIKRDPQSTKIPNFAW